MELLTIKDIMELMQIKTRQSFYNLANRHADFPKPIKLGGAKSSPVRYEKQEFLDWVKSYKER